MSLRVARRGILATGGKSAQVVGGTLVTSPWTGFGNALQFAGTANQGIYLGQIWSFTSSRTVELKFKRADTSNASTQVLFSRWVSAPTAANVYVDLQSGTGIIRIYTLVSNNDFYWTTTTAVNDTNNHEIAISATGSVVSFFLDGVLQGTKTASSSFTTPTSNTQIIVASSFRGTVDEVRLSNSARYTATYTPATTPFADDASTVALVHADSLSAALTTPR